MVAVVVGARLGSLALTETAWGLAPVFRIVRTKAVGETGVVVPAVIAHRVSLARRNWAFVARLMAALHRVTDGFVVVMDVAVPVAAARQG